MSFLLSQSILVIQLSISLHWRLWDLWEMAFYLWVKGFGDVMYKHDMEFWVQYQGRSKAWAASQCVSLWVAFTYVCDSKCSTSFFEGGCSTFLAWILATFLFCIAWCFYPWWWSWLKWLTWWWCDCGTYWLGDQPSGSHWWCWKACFLISPSFMSWVVWFGF